LAAGIREALGTAELRLHRVRTYNSICYADDQLMVIQHVYGLSPGTAPVLRLRGTAGEEMVAAYLGSFEHIWEDARPLA
jgi:hypothetical protein